MGIKNKKWFVMGIIGIIMAIGGAITFFISLFGIRGMTREVNNLTLATILLVYAISQLGDGTWFFMLTTQYSALIHYQRMLMAFRISLFVGIGVCVVGVILAIAGWLNYI